MPKVIRGGPLTNEIAAQLQEALPPPKPGEPKQFILVLIALVGLLFTIFTCLRTHDKTTIERCQNPTPDDLLLLRKAVRKHLGFFGNLFHGEKVVQKALAIAKTVTVEQLQQFTYEQSEIDSKG